MKARAGTLAVLVTALLLTATVAQGAVVTKTFIDGFDDSDVNEWSTTAGASISINTSVNGAGDPWADVSTTSDFEYASYDEIQPRRGNFTIRADFIVNATDTEYGLTYRNASTGAGVKVEYYARPGDSDEDHVWIYSTTDGNSWSFTGLTDGNIADNGDTITITLSRQPLSGDFEVVATVSGPDGSMSTNSGSLAGADGTHPYDIGVMTEAGTTATFDNFEADITTAEPVLNGSSATPTSSGGGSETFEIGVNDSDFSDGDTVNASLYLDGVYQGHQDLSSNGTASVTASVTSGEYNVTWTATDDAGATDTHTYTLPVTGGLQVYNESSPDDLIDDRTVTGTFYLQNTNNTVIKQETNTGVFDLSSLNTSDPVVASVQAPGYESRVRYIGTLTTDSSVFMLPDNATTVDIVFKLDDNTGKFPPGDSVLEVQRALNQSGDTRYRTIASDTFGAANELAVALEQDIRYRLVVTNPDGETRVLGPYTATANDPDAVLPIGEVQAVGDTSDDVAFAASLTDDGQRAVVMTYRDRTDSTTDLYLNVTNRDTGNTIRSNTSVSGPFGVYQETVLVPGSAPDNVTYIVEYHAVRDGEPTRNGTRIVGDIPEQVGVFELGSNVLFLLASGLVIAVTGAVALYSASAAAIVAPALATALTWLGALAIPLPLLAGAGAIGVLAAAGGAIR